MKIFNIIVILSISGKELFHLGTFRPRLVSEFENSANMNTNNIIRAQLFEYLNNPNIRGNTVMYNADQKV